MILKKRYLSSLVALFFSLTVGATSPRHNNPVANGGGNNNAPSTQEASFRNDCRKPEAQKDQDVNNVRARLTTGGDVWWDRADGKYVVPKPLEAGDLEVSSIFAGGVWLGGRQEGNFRVAAQQYGNGSGNSRDFWTGPLDDVTGLTNDTICGQWDRFWVVTREEIEEHLRLYNTALAAGTDYDPSLIPDGVKGWPGQGNQFFFEKNEFDLPATSAGLGSFFDNNGNEIYEPLDGDFPVIEIEGCDIASAPQYADQMYFWIYNDNGNIHTETNGDAIRMEIQVQSFAYATNDALNNMTFQRYKLINRAAARIDSTYFGMWVDADLGCYADDYIGCDTARSLGYYYNVDPQDGDVGVNCDGTPTYGTNIPALGVDYFRGPKRPLFNEAMDEVIGFEELGMSSFTYFNNPSFGNPPGPEQDPQTVGEYYNYLTGSWRDGSPFTEGGNGYGGTTPIAYAFPDAPDNPAGWSMCTSADVNNPEYDRRTLQASGPFILLPGEVNELIIGAVWMPDFDYPCPDLSRLFRADDLAQNLFDSCFDILDGPDAPDVDLIELDREVVLILTNDEVTSNNAFEMYEEVDIQGPDPELNPDLDVTYSFEGYQIYQLAGPNVTTFDDPSTARLIYQVDKKNGISEIINWEPAEGVPANIPNAIFVPISQVQGTDLGVKHTFVVKEDQFASGNDRKLVNHKKYYFSALAYAHNNWGDFDPTTAEGQSTPFIEGRRNISTYTALPRPITDKGLNAAYGDGAQITRIDGIGVGGNFVDMTAETRDQIVSTAFNVGQRFNEPIVYQSGRGPIDVKIYNPLDVKDGDFSLQILDASYNETSDLATWELTALPSNVVIQSDVTIDELNEQIIGEYGFSVSIGQTDEPGTLTSETNGALGTEEEYLGTNPTPWYTGVPNRGGDAFLGSFLSSYMAFATEGDIESFDPSRNLIENGSGFMPYQLANYRQADFNQFGYVSPAWIGPQAGFVRALPGSLGKLNNVDIVFTSNKELWSQCVIVETANSFVTNTIGVPTEGGASHMDVRESPSVGKEAGADGLPAVDAGAPKPVGMGWFPGYAVDVETGQRLNIFFGENSAYSCANLGGCDQFEDGVATGDDMMFNPSGQAVLPPLGGFSTAFNVLLGGQHFIYVTDQAYDKCAEIYDGLAGDAFAKVGALQNVTWTGVPILNTGASMKSYADGLIPSDLVVKLRADNAYANKEGVASEAGENPTYTFTIDGKEASDLDAVGVDEQMDMINVVPNPYYAISDYEGEATDNIVKITNLPAKCVVTIYTLDGKFIRQYNRDETGQAPIGDGISKTQVNPDIEWNLKNNKGIPVAGGVYLIHIDAEELGERVIKWFGTNRAFDPSQL